MRDRLIELLNETFSEQYEKRGLLTAEHTADFLLANGVIVPPCKVGDTVYVVSRYYGGIWQIYECFVDSLTVFNGDIFMSLKSSDGWYNFGVNVWEIGKTAFLAREEAEKALEEREGK